MRERIADRGIDIETFFRKFDKNGDGVFSPLEFECAFTALDIDIKKDDLRRFIKLTDSNKDGRVDFNEFYNVLNAPDEDVFRQSALGTEDDVDFEASFEKF